MVGALSQPPLLGVDAPCYLFVRYKLTKFCEDKLYIHVYPLQCRKVYRRTTLCAPRAEAKAVYTKTRLLYVHVSVVKLKICVLAWLPV